MSDTNISQTFTAVPDFGNLKQEIMTVQQMVDNLASSIRNVSGGLTAPSQAFTPTSSGSMRDASTGRFASAASVTDYTNKYNAQVSSAKSDILSSIYEKGATSFIGRSELGYASAVESGVLGSNGLPITKGEFSLNNYGASLEQKAISQQEHNAKVQTKAYNYFEKQVADQDDRIADKQDRVSRMSKQLNNKYLNEDLDMMDIGYGIANKANKDLWGVAKRQSVDSVEDSFPAASLSSAQMKQISKQAVADSGYVSDPTISSAWQNFQASYGGRFAKGALYTLGTSGAEYANAKMQEAQIGRPDFLAQGNAAGSLVGGIAGAAVGSFFPGYGTFIGAGVGQQLGGTIGQWMNVDAQKEMVQSIATQPIAALSYNLYAGKSGDWSYRGSRTVEGREPGGGARLSDMYGRGGQDDTHTIPTNAIFRGSQDIVAKAKFQREYIGLQQVGVDYNQASSTLEDMVAGYESTFLGILDAGENPNDPTPFDSMGMGQRKIGSHKRKKVDANGNPVGHWVDTTYRDHTFNSGRDVTDTIGRSTDVLNANNKGESPTGKGVVGGAGFYVPQLPTNGVPFNPYGSPTASGDSNGKEGTKFNSTSETQTYTSGIIERKGQKFVQDEEDVDDYEGVPTGQRELKYTYYRQNAERLFLSSSKEVLSKVFDPIYGAKNQTGDNIADIAMRFGGRAAAQYEQILTPFGEKPPVNVAQTTQFVAGMQGAERAATLAQLSVRDSGLKSMQAADNQMKLFVDKDGNELLPGAKSSVAYAQTFQKQIQGQLATWKETDTMGYNMDSMRLSNEERRYQVNPYRPGYEMGLELKGLGQDRQQMNVIKRRESYLRDKGMLSEDQEFQMESQIEGLQTNREERIGRLVDGVANRLPAMSAGRPAFASRIDSRQMTAYQFGLIGHPYRGAGALDNNQRTMQENFLKQYLDPSEIDSKSRTVYLNGLNVSGAGSHGGSQQAAEISATGVSSQNYQGKGTPSDATNTGQSLHKIAASAEQEVQLLRQILTKGSGPAASGKQSGEMPGTNNAYRNDPSASRTPQF